MAKYQDVIGLVLFEKLTTKNLINQILCFLNQNAPIHESIINYKYFHTVNVIFLF